MHKLTFVEGKEPTCTEPGSLEYWTCSDCGKNFADVYASKEISDITIPTKEHTPGEAATCTEPQTCTVCGEVIAPKTEHHYENGVCADCGEKELIPSEGLEFVLLGNAYAVIGIGTCTDTDVVIPSAYNGLPVTVIVDYAFEDCTGLTSVAIPDSVTTIGADAFRGCVNLTSVMIGNGVTSIWDDAFSGCESLTSIDIPDSVTSIGAGAFASCSALTSVSIGNSVTSIGANAFYGTAYYDNEQNWENGVLYLGKYLIDAKINLSGNYTVKEGTTLIADYAFSNCHSLTSITIPDGVTSIGWGAFWGCESLTSVTIGDGVTSIGMGAFAYCESLTSIVVSEGNQVYHSAGNCIIETSSGTLIAGCNNSNIPNDGSVTSIGYCAFFDCDSLTSITIPDSVTSIGEGAFAYCDSLTSITIPDSVTSIGSGAFYSCSDLTSISIPNSVTSIGDSAFFVTAYYNNEQNWEDGVLYLGKYLIDAKINLSGNYTVKEGTTLIADYAFSWCGSLTSVTIGDGVTSIGEYAFYDCDSLETVYYAGTEEQWNEIDISGSNSDLTNATIYFKGEW